MFKKAVEAKSVQRLSGADRKKLRRAAKERFSGKTALPLSQWSTTRLNFVGLIFEARQKEDRQLPLSKWSAATPDFVGFDFD
ncbi:hypothetical protein Syun_006875 [Stephania yunnanensis]|uniref:Uncharacterized protein n=1 Tax=Stephania yunnanensis TaxID=152371 RepID=A0AAP0KZ54_9MAGN